MKKLTLSILLALLAIAAIAGTVAAQGNPPSREGRGLLHDYIEQALADKLGLTLEEVEAQFNAGQTLWQIALANGIAEEDLPAFMQEVFQTALKAAVADGVITQAQADWMLQRMAQRGYGSGICPHGGTRPQDGTGFGFGRGMGMHRGGFWQNNNP